jgi:hypothetical protein
MRHNGYENDGVFKNIQNKTGPVRLKNPFLKGSSERCM